MIVAEIAASIVECVIMAEFLTRCLGSKNERFKVIEAAVCALLLFVNITVCPLFTDVEMVSVSTMLIIEMVYSILFLKGEIYKKVFVVFINGITMILINTAVLMLLGKILSSNAGDLITGNSMARLLVLFLTKFLYFLVTRLLLKFNGSSSYDFGKSEWIMLLTIFTVTFVVGIFKTNITRFISLRDVKPPVDIKVLRNICNLFTTVDSEVKLDPSFEYTNSNDIVHEVKPPYADSEHVKIFKQLQMLEGVGLVIPNGEEHMYWAAMHSKSCALTSLGKQYWLLAKKDKF